MSKRRKKLSLTQRLKKARDMVSDLEIKVILEFIGKPKPRASSSR